MRSAGAEEDEAERDRRIGAICAHMNANPLLVAERVKCFGAAGVDLRFARPGLASIIPVNANGFLRSPVEFITASFNSKSAATAWAVGNQGPVESAWRKSSDFPFAIQIALALTKPARYFGSLIDTKNYSYNNNLKQYLILSNINSYSSFCS